MTDDERLKQAVALARLAAKLMMAVMVFAALVITNSAVQSCTKKCECPPLAERP